jgi:uncharacterized membrane protein YcaP (DUF421 family)
VTEDKFGGKLREANVIERSEVRAFILETTEDVSVMHTRGNEKLGSYVMQDV